MKSTRRIGILLALVFLLPALFFSVFEISSLTKDEKMIGEIYNKQLEAILFSVNQYSDDLLSSWISKAETGIGESAPDTIPAKIKDLLTFNSSLQAIFLFDTIENPHAQRAYSLDTSMSFRLRYEVNKALTQNRSQISQLITYKRSGFQKVEALPYNWGERDNLQCLVFITGDEATQMRVCAMLVNPEIFIQDMIGPRLQVIAKGQFVLSAFNNNETVPIYSTITSDNGSVKEETLTKDFWLFPGYTIGIRIKDSSLKKLVGERTTTNLILLGCLDVILIIAVILVFRNVKREVQLAQNKSDFVSNVSHEIRTPLALISMFAETLEMGRVKSEEKKQEYYRIISKETQRLSGIVNKILNFSQAEANKKILTIQPLNVRKEIDEILTTYEYHLTNKGFEYTFTSHEEVWVKADKEAFVETIINLVDNAIKYSPDKRRIEITTGIENDYGTVAIKDFGMGISSADQKHIFDKFYRVPSGDLAKSRGTGLGLSLVQQLMDAQQGRVTVRSEAGKGSLFTLYFALVIS